MCKGPEAGGNLRMENGKQASVWGMKREEGQWYQMRLQKEQRRGCVIQGLVGLNWTVS